MKKIGLFLCFLFSAWVVIAQTESEKYFNEGKAEFEKENYFSAKGKFDQCLKLDKKNAEAFYYRGRTKVKLKDFESAIEDLEKAIKINPKHSSSMNSLGLIYSGRKEHEKAIIYFDRAIASDPKNPYFHMNKAFSYNKIFEFQKSADAYSAAIAINLDSVMADAYLFRSDCYNQMSNWKAAVDDLEKCLQYDSTVLIAKVNLAFGYLTLGKIKEADSIYIILYKTESQNPYVLSNYGYTKHKLGETEVGLKMIDESLKIKPDNSFAYKYLALIHIDKNEIDEACKNITRGLNLDYTKYYGNELEELKAKHCK